MRKYLLLIIIIFLGLFLRFYSLEEFPIQLSHDEVTQFYDAISIAQTGRDIYGNFMPFIFESIHDFKPPFYTYITIPFYLIFGDREITIRLPGAVFGVLLIPAVFIFVLKLLKNKNIALVSAFFTAIAPFEIWFSRKSFESGAGIFLILLGFSCLLHFIDKNSSKKWLYFGVILFGIALYTYFSHAIIIPLLLISFIIIFKKQFSFSRKFILPVLIFSLLSFPLIFFILTNSGTRFRSQTVFITKDTNLQRLIEYDKENRLNTFVNFSFNRYLDQFNPEFLFGNGLDLTDQDPLDVGPLLALQLPLLILGAILIIRNNQVRLQKRLMFAWVILGVIPSGLTFEVHSPHRMIMVFTMLNIFCAVGLYFFIKFAKIPAIIISTILLVSNFTYFAHMYLVNNPYEKSQHMHYPYKDVMKFAWSEYANFDQIIIHSKFGQDEIVKGAGLHYYLAYYGHVNPSRFQKELKINDWGISFDKFSIRDIKWDEDKLLKNTLIIVSPWSVPISTVDQGKILRVFTFYNKQPAFYAINYNQE